MTDQPDLTAAAYKFGKLIDPEVAALLRRAREREVTLHASNIKIIDGMHTIDGMPADQWLDAMTMW